MEERPGRIRFFKASEFCFYTEGMPIYEYACDDCGTKFEKLVRRSADGVACPSCGQDHLTTQYSTFAARSGGSTSMGAEVADSGCGAGMCGSGACGTGMCGMNFN